jgi:AcrR family transcriptional regulator
MAAHKTGWVGAAAKPDAGRDPRPSPGAHAGGGRRRNRPARAGPRLDYSPAALYRYFDNREQLTATLAPDAMARLAERLRAAAGDGHTDPLLRLGEAYLAFAQEEPVRFRLLFVDLPSARTSLRALPPHHSPYRIVLAAARTAIAQGRLSPRLDAESVAYTLWSLVHGMAVLESTHLRGFDADFAGVHRLALQHLVASWMPGEREGGRKG